MCVLSAAPVAKGPGKSQKAVGLCPFCNAHKTGGKVEPGRHTSDPTCARGRVLTPIRTVTGTSRTQTGAGGAFRAGQAQQHGDNGSHSATLWSLVADGPRNISISARNVFYSCPLVERAGSRTGAASVWEVPMYKVAGQAPVNHGAKAAARAQL